MHRLVILPDYQGIGLGTIFLNKVAELYDDFDFTIITSAKNLINALNNDENWYFKRYGRKKYEKSMKRTLKKSFRGNVKTASFLYIPKNTKKGN